MYLKKLVVYQLSDIQHQNGVDFSPYLKANGGYIVKRMDLDSEEAGVTLDGVEHRDRICTKKKVIVKTIPLSQSTLQTLLASVKPEWVMVEYFDPEFGEYVIKKMYSNNIDTTAMIQKLDGNGDPYILWDSVEFPFVPEGDDS